MTGYRLYKVQRLCSLKAIDALFSSSQSRADENNCIMAYPWRAVWRINPRRADSTSCPQFLISVGKKKLRHAVDRVTMRRRCREAYRLNQHSLPTDQPIDLAFIYIADKLTPYHSTERAMKKIISRINGRLGEDVCDHETE